ncbi:MAG: polysaccharide pyruvyl transferase family protein [Parcubacteria group bacterium]|jgi:colanic acid/amylovoran biosynthesis protein
MKNILLTGQCTLHKGRMESGNIGNYYILEPLIQQIKKTFPGVDLQTTFQLTASFCKREKVISLPMNLYYSWSENDLDLALKELGIALIFHKTNKLISKTPFISAVMDSDMVIDFSGDIWGDNADLVGDNRFLIGSIKDRVAQLLKKKTVMLAGSPGPFKDENILKFAKEVYSGFDLVTNRESISKKLLRKQSFDVSRTKDYACPAFLFESKKNIEKILEKEGLNNRSETKLGFILCGWNFTKGPYNKPRRKDADFLPFVKLIEHISRNYSPSIYLLSHSNGFDVVKDKFKLKHGRDYPIIKQLENILRKRKVAKKIHSLNGIYDPWTTKALIGNFDMLVSGRIHGSVAGLSQMIPTVMIDYGHEPKAHKIKGFAEVVGVGKYVADPVRKNDLINKFDKCWSKKDEIKKLLKKRIPRVKKLALQNFSDLRNI